MAAMLKGNSVGVGDSVTDGDAVSVGAGVVAGSAVVGNGDEVGDGPAGVAGDVAVAALNRALVAVGAAGDGVPLTAQAAAKTASKNGMIHQRGFTCPQHSRRGLEQPESGCGRPQRTQPSVAGGPGVNPPLAFSGFSPPVPPGQGPYQRWGTSR